MVKDNDILQAVREQDIDNLNKLLIRSKNGKSEYTFGQYDVV